jgi:hypothetical protein
MEHRHYECRRPREARGEYTFGVYPDPERGNSWGEARLMSPKRSEGDTAPEILSPHHPCQMTPIDLFFDPCLFFPRIYGLRGIWL